MPVKMGANCLSVGVIWIDAFRSTIQVTVHLPRKGGSREQKIAVRRYLEAVKRLEMVADTDSTSAAHGVDGLAG